MRSFSRAFFISSCVALSLRAFSGLRVRGERAGGRSGSAPTGRARLGGDQLAFVLRGDNAELRGDERLRTLVGGETLLALLLVALFLRGLVEVEPRAEPGSDGLFKSLFVVVLVVFFAAPAVLAALLRGVCGMCVGGCGLLTSLVGPQKTSLSWVREDSHRSARMTAMNDRAPRPYVRK